MTRPLPLACVLAAAALTSCSLKSDLPVYGSVPAFQLTDQENRRFSSDTLTDRVYVVCFFFTTCNGPCPRMNAQMKKIQDQTEGLDYIHLLSLTVDPATDTPEALARYAARFKADPRRWHFLTGAKEELQKLSDDTFHLNAIATPTLDHSTRFVLVDRKARIRAYYDSSDSNAIEQVMTDIAKLRKEVF